MGTDINMFAEVRNGSRWMPAEPLVSNDLPMTDSPEDEPPLRPVKLYDTRNYALFAILANVRNPSHSATPFDCISDPKGLPADVSQPIKDWHACWKEWAFGESWLGLDELLAIDWHGKQIVRRGMVDPRVAHLFPPGRRGFPFAEWPKGISIGYAHQSRDGVEVQWIETYAEAAGDEFMSGALSTLRAYGSPQDVRVVFWFDN